MWQLFIEFWRLSDPNVVWVLSGAILLGAGAGVIGCFAFLRKRSLTGDALAHAALPGVTTAFILFQTRDPLVIFGGAMTSCLLGYLLIEYLINQTRIKEDSAFAIVLSLFFALGIFQLTMIQKSGLAAQAGLDKLLFGQAASLVRSDVMLLGGLAVMLLLFVVIFFQKLKLICFDRDFASASGTNVRVYELLLAAAIVVSVVIGLQLVGVVLMAAIMLTPAAAARYWSNDLKVVLLLAGVFGAISGIIGANVSYLAPRMPTGPWMVVGVTAIFALSMLCAPRRGLLGRLRRRFLLGRRVAEENLLRTIYKIGEQRGGHLQMIESGAVLSARSMEYRQFDAALQRLIVKGKIEQQHEGFRLTPSGLERAKEVTRFHRLWELYLTRQIHIAEDHVHDDADEIEHILTPELEARLMAELDSPAEDPHGKSIPPAQSAMQSSSDPTEGR